MNRVFSDKVTTDLFAGFPVSDYQTSLAWYEQLFGLPLSFLPNDIEAVWELAEHRYAFIKVLPENAGNAFNLIFLSDLDSFVAEAGKRGISPSKDETLENGVHRITYKDPDGNEMGFAGTPAKDFVRVSDSQPA